MEVCAWLLLRIIYAWMLLSRLLALLKDWEGTKDMTRLLVSKVATTFLSMVMLCVVFFWRSLSCSVCWVSSQD